VLDPGSTLGEFQILETLGSGAMGQVYRAQGPGDEVVAIKVISSALASDQSACQRFASESAILGDLRQPRIVAARSGLEREGEVLYYAMEWVEGTDLAALLEQRGSLEQSEALSAVADVLEALSYAHARDVLHRDVKASNVLVDPSGRMKLSDFGLARALDGTRVTRPGSVLGTPAYMAPELAEGGQASVETEVYAVGVLLHELLAGAPPFGGESALAVLNQHVNASPPPLEGVGAQVQAIVARALAKRPRERFASATEMRDAVLLARGSAAGAVASAPRQRSAREALAVAETRELGVTVPEPADPEGSDPSGPAAYRTTLVSEGEPPAEPMLRSSRDGEAGPRSALPWVSLLMVLGLIGVVVASSALRPPPPPASRAPSPERSPAAPSESSSPERSPAPNSSGDTSPEEAPGHPQPSPALVEVRLHNGVVFRAELVRIDVAGDRLLTRFGGAPRTDPLDEVDSYRRLE